MQKYVLLFSHLIVILKMNRNFIKSRNIIVISIQIIEEVTALNEFSLEFA